VKQNKEPQIYSDPELSYKRIASKSSSASVFPIRCSLSHCLETTAYSRTPQWTLTPVPTSTLCCVQGKTVEPMTPATPHSDRPRKQLSKKQRFRRFLVPLTASAARSRVLRRIFTLSRQTHLIAKGKPNSVNLGRSQK
jgi:hypothetical protein